MIELPQPNRPHDHPPEPSPPQATKASPPEANISYPTHVAARESSLAPPDAIRDQPPPPYKRPSLIVREAMHIPETAERKSVEPTLPTTPVSTATEAGTKDVREPVIIRARTHPIMPSTKTPPLQGDMMRSAVRPIDKAVDKFFRLTQEFSPHLHDSMTAGASQLEEHGNESFHRARPVQYGCVPVAADREDMLATTLDAIAGQSLNAPTMPRIVLSLNHTERSFNERQIGTNRDIVHAFQDARPEVPLSYFEAVYKEGSPIGLVRDGLLGSPLLLARQEAQAAGVPLEDMIFTSWDADTSLASPNYFAQTQQRFKENTADIWEVWPLLRHDRLDENRFPLANSLLRLVDTRMRLGRLAAPGHFSVNGRAFAHAEGFGPATIGEHGQLIRNAQLGAEIKRPGGIEVVRDVVSNLTEATVSSRRLVAHMALGQAVEYGRLGASSYVNIPKLTRDVSASYYTSQLPKLAFDLANTTMSEQMGMLHANGMDIGTAFEQALAYAERATNIGAVCAGVPEEFRSIISEEAASYVRAERTRTARRWGT